MPQLRLSVPLTARALTGAALLAALVLILPGAASARASSCTAKPAHAHVPYLTAPCDGATVRRRHAIVFKVHDADPTAASHAPYLNLQTSRTMIDGHLSLNSNGNGIFAQMSAAPGHSGTWTFTARREIYASWWDNRPGTYYVQVEQVDPQAASGVLYGPITTVKVPAVRH